jgi:hypothetical protein
MMPSATFTYSVSFRLFHPHLDSETITARLGKPHHQSKTHWTQRLSNHKSLPETMAVHAQSLMPHKAFLRRFIKDGGRVEYFIGWFTTPTSGGDTFSHDLLARLADLRIDLSFDVYSSK